MGLESPSQTELLINSIAFFVPSLLFFAGRCINGIFLLKRIQVDDYLMGVIFVVYTALLVFINVSAHFATNLFPPDQLDAIMADSHDVENRIVGSIIVIMLEQCMLLSTWGIKICLLIFLYRMTDQMPRTRIILWTIAGYVVLSYILIQVLYYAILCRPFQQYYALPVTNIQCATYSTYSKIQMVFNITSDVFIILLPTSVLWRSGLPIKRKLLLIVLFSLGVFTIICVILNKYYNFASPQTTVYQLWYIREASVAVWVGNLICCWQLAQLIFRMRSFDGMHSGSHHRMGPYTEQEDGQERRLRSNIKHTTRYDGSWSQSIPDNSLLTDGGQQVGREDISTIFSLSREDEHADATPAIDFRIAHNID